MTTSAGSIADPPPPPEILVTALPLRRLRPGPPLHDSGVKAHGLFFQQLLPPRLAALFHPRQGGGDRPYRITPLLTFPDERGRPVSDPSVEAWSWLRITLLDREHLEAWCGQALPSLPTWVHLGPDDTHRQPSHTCWWDFALGQENAGPRALVAAHTYAELLDRPLAHRWRMEFVTPTAFSQPVPTAWRKQQPEFLTTPFPLPALILESLRRRWAACAPAPMRDLFTAEAVRDVAACMQVESFAIAPERANNRIGFTGWVQFSHQPVRGEPPTTIAGQRRLLTTLLHFAWYSGVGVQTTRGMGVVTVE